MAPPPDNRYSVSTGGDAFGPVVAGHDNRVEVRQAPPADARGRRQGTPRTPKTNTASDSASVYTVMNGELHIHYPEGADTP
ncbi:hypothetical protein [Streptomyces reniochalinae]|uniref:Uncharacterized protein n=1 Tax=Streptomyces reniochalinae TaxID=2250578 RepID=A0A367E974_9ACTN|nr:hypothetical protein [Streptomyces reniochalinae]RCG14606.1 hypothetical protein DQ392_26100 [Streptomyces reniochalinae]